MTEIIKQLNQIQADAHGLYLKLHDIHWNVKGLQFFGIHEYAEKSYNELHNIFDDVAERAIMLGGKAITCSAELLKTTHIEHKPKESYSGTESLELILKDFEHLLSEFKKLDKLSEKDNVTAAYAQEKIAKYEKEIWMIKATLNK